MKKLGLLILGGLIGAFATYYFCPRELPSVPVDYLDGPFEKPLGLIKPENAKQLNDNWTKYREPAVDSCISMQSGGKIKVDNRSSWWSLKDIRNYLKFAKKYSDSTGYKMTGIRVYLGVYGDDAPKKKKDFTTMFIVPTGHKKTSKGSVLPVNNISANRDNGDLGTPPLNDGANGLPPGAGYPR